MGAGTDGRLHPRVPIRVPLALLAAGTKRVRLLQIPGTGEYTYYSRLCRFSYSRHISIAYYLEKKGGGGGPTSV